MPIEDWTVAFKQAFAEAEAEEQVAAAQLHAATMVKADAEARIEAARVAKEAAEAELARLNGLRTNPVKAKKEQAKIITESDAIVTAQSGVASQSASDIQRAETQLREAQAQRAEALSTARGEYSRTNRALRPLVAELGTLADDHPINQIYAELERTLHADDFDVDRLYSLTLELERQVLSLQGPTKAPGLLGHCNARLEVQDNGPFKISPALSKIRKELKRINTSLSPETLAGVDPSAALGEAMVALTRVVEPALDNFEAAATKFLEAFDAL
ncbi:MAG TPA: hypothetical protein PKW90_26840, partial [Myxococcota bacterium]|nr:hypothetical protein [Myxococcota bacterium]